ncbi:urease accessory protein UreD [Mycobacterium sp. IDR2000157661]|uniref:urease accessory protein UreD n=1 Tax=Mycobacterium sp. IDR2000157661 TaxID=2867005 RepID=UPI001EEB8E15|nr:urease accessory protein UreD [Mycobacterium sp. IDR2000157661]ULE32426.1 urease accessory protein UreD [Mycobacterium sp. IDR2000157661]
MRSDVVIVAPNGRRPRIECTGGLAARLTAADTVHLVSAAATPLGGDVITVRVVVESGARLAIRSAAATVALPGAATPESQAIWALEVAGDLDLDPQPTVVAGASRHVTTTRLTLTGTARVRVRERVQIGRSGERQGFWSGALHADVDGMPLLRHRMELGDGSVADDALGTPRACVSELRYPQPDFPAAGAVLALASGGALATWQGERL